MRSRIVRRATTHTASHRFRAQARARLVSSSIPPSTTAASMGDAAIGKEINLPGSDQFAVKMDDFARCIQGASPAGCQVTEGLRDVKIMLAIYESIRTNAAVKARLETGAAAFSAPHLIVLLAVATSRFPPRFDVQRLERKVVGRGRQVLDDVERSGRRCCVSVTVLVERTGAGAVVDPIPGKIGQHGDHSYSASVATRSG